MFRYHNARYEAQTLEVRIMRCEWCNGTGKFKRYYHCVECNGSGILSCCDTAGSNVGEVSMKKVGDYISENVREIGAYISEKDRYVFANNSDSYLIWDRTTGQIVWVGEEGKLGKDGYSIAWDRALEFNESLTEAEMKYTIVACNKINDSGPPVASRIGTCTKCKSSIYISNSTPIPDNAIYMCMECINWENIDLIQDPTEEQLQDIAESLINKKLGGSFD
jgi:hypothetical protein